MESLCRAIVDFVGESTLLVFAAFLGSAALVEAFVFIAATIGLIRSLNNIGKEE